MIAVSVPGNGNEKKGRHWNDGEDWNRSGKGNGIGGKANGDGQENEKGQAKGSASANASAVGTRSGEIPEEEKLPSGLAKMFGGSLKQAAPYVEAAYSLVGAILGLGFIGWLLDRHFGTAPTWLAVGLLLGAFVGLYGLARAVLWRR